MRRCDLAWVYDRTCLLGIIVIMVGAIVMVTGKNGFNMMDSGFEYNYVLIAMSLALIGTGPGSFKIGCGCKKE